MSSLRISVAGALSLLGQHLLARLASDPDFYVESLHDRQGLPEGRRLDEIVDWDVDPAVRMAYSHMPVFPADAPAKGSLLLSFLPDTGAEAIEAQHLARGTRVLSHCEYARRQVPLLMPGLADHGEQAPHLATPNCTTAICAALLAQVHQRFEITDATITAMQAISGTDLPGMPASAIHDQVICDLPGEAAALADELGILFDSAFPLTTFAARVPVWRGHTMTLALDLARMPAPDDIAHSLREVPGIAFDALPFARDRFSQEGPLCSIVHLSTAGQKLRLIVKGDNLEASTTGVMQRLAKVI